MVQKYVLSELDSGERVISERIPSVRSVAIGFWIGAGSRDETDAKAGVSHFIEHLLFKGSRTYSAQEIAEIFDGLGGELNAATSREHTMVYARVPDDHVQTALNVLTDMVFAPAFSDLDSERDVVLEQIAMYEDTPQELVHDLFSEAVFGRHALGRPVIGTADVISTVTKRVLSTYHRQTYAGGNVVIAAAGNLEHNKLVRMLQRAQSQQRPPAGGPRVRRPLVKAPPPGLVFAKTRPGGGAFTSGRRTRGPPAGGRCWLCARCSIRTSLLCSRLPAAAMTTLPPAYICRWYVPRTRFVTLEITSAVPITGRP